MENLIDKIEKKKRAYIDEIVGKKEDYDGIVIYGAGRYGRELLKLLKNNSIVADYFCVTSKEYNLEKVEGISVISLEELKRFKKGYLVLVAVKSPLNRDLVANLNNVIVH